MSGTFLINLPGFAALKSFLERRGLSGQSLVVLAPFVWLSLFFLIPLLVVAKISLSEAAIARPPYLPIAEFSDGFLSINLNFGNYQFLLDDPLYLNAYLESIKIAGISTIFALLIGYPMAYLIARSPADQRNTLLMLVVLPFWTSFLLRVYAWIGFLKSNGLILSLIHISEPTRPY